MVQSSKTSAFSQRTASADEGACEISFFENAYLWEKEELFTGFSGDKLPVVSYNMTMFETVPAETKVTSDVAKGFLLGVPLPEHAKSNVDM